MITEINIKNVATYRDTGGKIENLKKVNFFFGANGSGKTTISRVIGKLGDTKYSECLIKWLNEERCKDLVYNRDFVEENFRPQENLKGIFTLGKAEADTQEKIAETEQAVKFVKEKLEGLRAQLESAGAKLEGDETRFREWCWKNIKEEYTTDFGENVSAEVFSGLNRSQQKFLERVLKEYEKYKNISEIDIEQLKQQAQTVFDKSSATENEIEELDAVDLKKLENIAASPLLQKAITGKEDSAFGDLIKKLKNSDWVRQGLENYIHGAGDPCPFCQQRVEADILEKMRELYDEQYRRDLKSLEDLKNEYAALCEDILNIFNGVQTVAENFLDKEAFLGLKERLKAVLDKNRKLIEGKIEKPSQSIQLLPVSAVFNEAQGFLRKINGTITDHNDAINNRIRLKAEFVQKFWAYMICENKSFIEDYVERKKELDKNLAELNVEIRKQKVEYGAKEQELRALQSNLEGVEEAVNSINAMLKAYGFANFELATCGEKNQFYKTKRPDGSDVEETLSEGERSFVTFLYFYHLVKAELERGQDAKIVIFDDPVSSLDSSVLFIVSQLIRELIQENELKKADSNKPIKQIFILTHNLYFHKRVSYELSGDLAFYVIRKDSKGTVIESMGKKNTVINSYECLWSELRFFRDKNDRESFILMQNIMRRILEYYFEDIQGWKKETLANKFTDEERIKYSAFLQWLGAGSHRVPDEEFYGIDGDIESFLQCFELIFVRNSQEPHYKRMINKR